jgi:NADH dehydrogenase
MSQKIVIIGSGFAGLWSALGARRLIEQNKDRLGNGIDVIMIAPEPKLVSRPRLYEANAADMSAPLSELLNVTGVQFVRGIVDVIRTEDKQVEVVSSTGERSSLSYDRLVLAAGSRLVKPNIPGLREHAFNIDTITDAADLEAHLRRLASLPSSPERNTVVVCGGGFTGIELATELPRRLRAIFGMGEKVRVVVVEKSEFIGPDLGEGPRPIITQAFSELEVETRLGSPVASIDANGVVTSSGERIDARTIVWTAGVEATPLTKQIPGEKDVQGRLIVDSDLRVPSSPDVFATGDAACADTDGKGNNSLMSCQHAVPLGRSAGHNVAADLLKIPSERYLQPTYGTCLDLGSWGAVICKGWDRQLYKTGGPAKEIKGWINGCAIYPPKANAKEAFDAANPMINLIPVFE